MTVTVVVGPPSGGAAEYARDHQWPGEPVVDLDRMLVALGADVADDASDLIRRTGYAARSGAIGLLLDAETDTDAIVVHTAPTADHVAMYENAGCEFVLVDPGEDTCIERARAADRPSRVEDAIRSWYADPPALPEGTTVVSDVEAQDSARKGPSMTSSKRLRAASASRYWGEAPVPRTKAEFFNAVTTPSPIEEGGTVATIRMYGPIDSWGGFWGISAKDMGVVLDGLPDSVDRIILRINSPGGEVFEGAAILNMLRAHSAKVTAVVDGLAASAASVIAAGADETVMSPGTQMMIHRASTIVWGNADDMRKEAKVLEGIDASITEIYQGKAGEKDWPTLLSDETWMTAAEAKSMGLADRVAVIPDAGEAVTAGEEEPDEELLLPDDDVEDSAAARVIRIVNRHIAPRPPAPVVPNAMTGAVSAGTLTARRIASGAITVTDIPQTTRATTASGTSRPAEPGIPNTEGVDPMADLRNTIATRLGIPAENVTDEQVVTALDERLASAPTNVVPGTRIVDDARLEQLEADAAAGREARAEQVKERRAKVVDKAIEDGKIPPSRRDHYVGLMKADEEGTTELLDQLAAGTIPTAEKGESGGITGASDDDTSLYNQAAGLIGTAAANEKE